MTGERVLTASELRIDLSRLRDNYRIIAGHVDGVDVAAMVKADGYGLGASHVAGALRTVGCRQFFVAQAEEGVALRADHPDLVVNVLNGVMPGTEDHLVEHNLVPVLNSLEQISYWQRAARRHDRPLPAVLHFDTGMSRLGMASDEAVTLAAEAEQRLAGIEVVHVMSHLASADVEGSEQSQQQLDQFVGLRRSFPHGTASLANSAGIFLGARYHFDVVRPGVALYGGTPLVDGTNPMRQVVTLETPIIQVRNVTRGETIGYGATHVMDAPGKVATVALGYADGFLRASSGRGIGSIGGLPAPIVGRISMDLITLDVSAIPEDSLYLGAPVELIGDDVPIDDVARAAGSIAHEMLVDLGSRYQRSYVDNPTP